MRRWRTTGNGRKGFTLVELVVVMTIITILAGAVAIQVTNRIRHAKRARAVQDIYTLETALDLYAADNGNSPTTQQGLEALRNEPSSAPAPQNWNGPYVKKAVPADPWGSEYVYRNPGQLNPDSYDLISYGEDGRPGGDNEFTADITNADEQ